MDPASFISIWTLIKGVFSSVKSFFTGTVGKLFIGVLIAGAVFFSGYHFGIQSSDMDALKAENAKLSAQVGTLKKDNENLQKRVAEYEKKKTQTRIVTQVIREKVPVYVQADDNCSIPPGPGIRLLNDALNNRLPRD